MKVTVVGTGYVGLVVGTCLADSGHTVVCVDKDVDKIKVLKTGAIPNYEPGLSDLVKRNGREGRLIFSSDLAAAVKDSEVSFICVGTPPDENGRADLSAVLAVARALGEHLHDDMIVVLKSTVPVGTADKVRAVIDEVTDKRYHVVSNPEFLKEGAAVDDFTRPDRVVIGTDSKFARAKMKEIYAPFVRTGKPILLMDNRSAEFTKYVANCMLATKISFINEMANLAERVGADIALVRKGIGTDRRIGYEFLFPGIGYGGSCFPKDVEALVMTGEETGYDLQLMRAVHAINLRQKQVLFDKAHARFDGDLKGKRLAVWGLSFKPRTDDMREAPSLILLERLIEAGAEVCAYDPEAMDNARGIFGDKVELFENAYDCLDGAEALFIVTEWNNFRRPNFDDIKARLKNPIIFDGRNLYKAPSMAEMGFEYYGIGIGLTTEGR